MQQMMEQSSAPYAPDEETQKIFAAFKAEAEKRQLTSIDNFDKSILSYSSAGLALSLTFLKDFVPVYKASATWLLFGSWALFVVSTCLTIVSFLVSNKVQEFAISDAEKYYLEGNDEFLNKVRWQDKYIAYSNGIAGFAFVIALASSAGFVWVNIDVRKDPPNSNDSTRQLVQIVNETQSVSSMPISKPSATARPKQIKRKKTSKPVYSETEKPTCYCKVPNE